MLGNLTARISIRTKRGPEVRRLTLILFFFLTLPPLVLAAPAPWYRYQSLATGRYICTQVDPGPHYVKSSGPWSNAGCRPR